MSTEKGDKGNRQRAQDAPDEMAPKRGFAAMDALKQRQIASKGGQAAHEQGRAHEFSSDEARLAGRKGGIAVSRDREYMAEIGRRGGESRQAAGKASSSSTKHKN